MKTELNIENQKAANMKNNTNINIHRSTHTLFEMQIQKAKLEAVIT